MLLFAFTCCFLRTLNRKIKTQQFGSWTHLEENNFLFFSSFFSPSHSSAGHDIISPSPCARFIFLFFTTHHHHSSTQLVHYPSDVTVSLDSPFTHFYDSLRTCNNFVHSKACLLLSNLFPSSGYWCTSIHRQFIRITCAPRFASAYSHQMHLIPASFQSLRQ